MNTQTRSFDDGLKPNIHASYGSNGGYGTDAASARADASVDPDASVGTLLKELMHEVPTLVTKELALAKSEMRENLESTKEGMMAVSAGGVVLLGGYVVLLMSAVYGLSNVLEPWLAALIVGGIAAMIGFAMVNAGKQKLSAQELRPDHTMRTVRKDADAIRGRTS